jgi:diguanylate cyclase (GGDEF)-like protein
MSPQTRLNLADFPNSPYAAELRDGGPRLRFKPDLEVEYIRTHVERVRLRVRVWFSVAFAVTPFFVVGVLARNDVPWNLQTLLQAFVTVPCTLILVWLAWSRRYADWYLPAATVLVPLYGVSLSILTAMAVGAGQTQEISGLTLNVFGVLFFSGLMFRTSLVTSIVMLVAFIGFALRSHMDLALAVQCEMWLALTAGFGVVVHRDIDRSYRKNFLEEALIGELVARDALSGLMNRRAFDEHLMRVWQHALRDRRALAILMIDIDHFKQFNDNHGHQAGDVVLRRVAQTIHGFARRPLDLAARYGGEEFAVILYDLAPQHVQDTAERLRRAVQELHSEIAVPNAMTAITVSIGVGLVEPRLDRTPGGALQLADEALYEAKHAGRNCVVIKGADDYSQLTTGSFKTPVFGERQP